MGEVYEAEHLDDRRRVAIKILNQRLATPADRARFLREGQLAAALSHPNSVYVFGSQEIAGVPVITMELVPGGTLKDRVTEHGPLPPREAVDAILQVIAGLEAAHAVGILHRDVKPANCFVDVDGTVKIGDFGLSISTMRDLGEPLTEAGVIQGTPQYAAPEQLRGESLDLRADIYGVGATLFYLLTARAPFEASTLTALIARVMTDAAPAAALSAPDVPDALDRVLAACLAKVPSARPADYASLRAALLPFSSHVPTAATLPERTAAGFIDHLLLLPVAAAVTAGFERRAAATLAAGFVAQVLYFTVTEGGWGRSAGKAIVGLRVMRSSSVSRPGFARASGRALLYGLAWYTGYAVALALTDMGYRASLVEPLGPLLTCLWLFVLFGRARHRTGFIALHDAASGTRVVARPREATGMAIESVPVTPVAAPRPLGPYRVTGALGPTTDGTLFVGVDPVLKRDVWVHEVAPAAPPVSAARRALSRPARQKWLTGRRTSIEAWDAYEALDGASLLRVAVTPQPWAAVRRWLASLARELSHASADGTLPRLSIANVWVTRGGDVRLLDFTPDLDTAPSPQQQYGLLRFLHDTAVLGLTGATAPQGTMVDRPLSLPARETLARLARGDYATVEEACAAIDALARCPDAVSRRRRAASCVFLPTMIGLLLVSVAVVLHLFRHLSGKVATEPGPGTPRIDDAALGAALSAMWPPTFDVLADVMSLITAQVLVLGVAWTLLAWFTRGGFVLRLWGLAVTDARGQTISRARAVLRTLVGWVPLLLAAAAVILLDLGAEGEMVIAIGGLSVWVAGLVYAVAVPERGAQDWCAGTWLVPR